MINPAADFCQHVNWNKPSKPTRKRVVRVLPLHILAPAGHLVAGLPLEQAVAFYQHLVASSRDRDGIGDLLSAHGTCSGIAGEVRDICITAPRPRKGRRPAETPSRAFASELRQRLCHALLGPSRVNPWPWRKEQGLDPSSYTKEIRVSAPWRQDVNGEDMERLLDKLGALAHRCFRGSPNDSHPQARWAHDLTIGFTPDGFSAHLYYSYKRDTSTWHLTVYSRWGESFSEFVVRATDELDGLLKTRRHDWMTRKDAEYAEWTERRRLADRARKAAKRRG